MRSCRRRLLDKALEDAVNLMQGDVLDIGGSKYNKRGNFRPPLEKVTSWKYLNSNPDTKPDYCCDAAAIPIEDNSIDTVVMTEVLEYLDSPDDVLSEIFRVLKAGRFCIISVPFLHPVHGDCEFDRLRWTDVKLDQACRKAGFSKIKTEPMGSTWAVIHDILRVWFGYSRPNPDKIYLKVLRKILNAITPFSLWLDTKIGVSEKYINTGYFVILEKTTESNEI